MSEFDAVKYRKEYYQKNKHIWKTKYYPREKRLAKEYNMTSEDYLKLLEDQNYQCAICKVEVDPELFQIDHCHTKGNVRGLLCKKCNLGLGLFGDSIDSLKNAIDYLLDN